MSKPLSPRPSLQLLPKQLLRPTRRRTAMETTAPRREDQACRYVVRVRPRFRPSSFRRGVFPVVSGARRRHRNVIIVQRDGRSNIYYFIPNRP